MLVGLLAAAAFVPSGAASHPSEGRLIPVDPNSAIRIPSLSPVRLLRVGKDGDAHFAGRFVLTGKYSFGCNYDCQAPLHMRDLTLVIRPDGPDADRLPRWDQYRTGIEVSVVGAEPFIRRMVTPRQRAAVLSGKVDHVSGRASIELDRLVLSIECDSPFYSAHFVDFAKARPATRRQNASDYGCL
jgi:hypothetical protein